jgi:hypothetical protein
MVALAREAQTQLAQPNDRRDDADRFRRRFQPAALFDVRLQIGDLTAGLEARTRPSRETRGFEHVFEALALPVRRTVNRVVDSIAHEAAAAEQAGKRALFVDPRSHVHGEMLRIVVFRQRAGNLQTVDHAHRAVEPAAGRLRVGM